jgi:hypothetical protein
LKLSVDSLLHSPSSPSGSNKRVTLTSAPQLLMFKLNRLVMNERHELEKINDEFTFPFELDMSPYRPLDDVLGTWMYDLVGVIVHRGTRRYLSSTSLLLQTMF